ncbi:hypothetical protein [Streptomyces sp. NPDC012825]|uniref:hypothetical protein n=1 Tax=Streptomyces sp. NPDC012825 TaxID=3364851 RepID=UPI0036A8BEB3
MEILLAACLLAWAAGAQSERAALGVSPAQRALIKEQVRHDRTVQKIAEKHGTAPPPATGSGVPLSTTVPAPVAPGSVPAAPEPVTIPAAFLAGYRGHTPVARVATPVGRHVGGWAARGVAWTKDSGRSAVKEFRKRRAAEGKPDPAPVLAPIPPMPTEPPTVGTTPATPVATVPSAATVPPKPAEPPTAGTVTPPTPPGADGEDLWSDTDDDKSGSAAAPKAPEKAPEAASGPSAAAPGGTEPSEPPTGPQGAVEPPVVAVPAPRLAEPAQSEPPESGPEPATVSGPEPAPAPVPEPSGGGGSKTPTTPQGGIGRMASEISYGSVMEESDELALMCDDDLLVYKRIKDRCVREIGRADELKAQLKSGGVKDWVTRCQEQYRQLLVQMEDLETNTVSQAEAVVKAKALLEQGQGFYADIALDMESVEERQFYISDQTDAEDTNAVSETYETKGASA